MASTLIRPRVAAVVYVSTTSSPLLTELRKLAAGSASARLLTVFTDEPYARTSFLIAGEPGAVSESAVRVATAAAAALDLRAHVATHPRIGVVDHISVAPIDSSDLEPAAAAAAAIGAGFAPAVPVYFYGGARADGRSLAATRRLTPYFGGGATWTTAPDLPAGATSAAIDPRLGACCCGASALVLNYNLLLETTDAAVARAIASAVRTRSGGPPGVEALALEHEGGRYEVACNLLAPETTSPAAVRALADAAAAAHGTSVRSDYTIGLTTAQIRAKLEAAA
jgi:glutamate formiminotransferase